MDLTSLGEVGQVAAGVMAGIVIGRGALAGMRHLWERRNGRHSGSNGTTRACPLGDAGEVREISRQTLETLREIRDLLVEQKAAIAVVRDRVGRGR
jgi:hypothetical protein